MKIVDNSRPAPLPKLADQMIGSVARCGGELYMVGEYRGGAPLAYGRHKVAINLSTGSVFRLQMDRGCEPVSAEVHVNNCECPE